jgi:hypothetical protein
MQVVISRDQLAIKSEQESRMAFRGLISAACKCWLLLRRVRTLSSRERNETLNLCMTIGLVVSISILFLLPAYDASGPTLGKIKISEW